MTEQLVLSSPADSAPLVVVSVPWPHYPMLTATGAISLSSRAGRLVPWLSLNAVHGMHRRVWQESRQLWRAASAEAARAKDSTPMAVPVRAAVQLYRYRGRQADVGALVEGLKPLVDGLCDVGLLIGDGPRELVGFDALPMVHCAEGADRAVIALVPA